mmetsp:Transcript_35359/g.94758  ORF Transcript_35359/g.94758 Transcript_35359/m.94758 type:complete len:245 (+) Transcript_35359:616-1350(+)
MAIGSCVRHTVGYRLRGWWRLPPAIAVPLRAKHIFHHTRPRHVRIAIHRARPDEVRDVGALRRYFENIIERVYPSGHGHGLVVVGELHLLARRSSEQQLRQLHPKIVLRRLIPRAHCEQRRTITVGDEPEGLADRLFLHRLHVLINIVFVRDDQQGNRHRSHDPRVRMICRDPQTCALLERRRGLGVRLLQGRHAFVDPRSDDIDPLAEVGDEVRRLRQVHNNRHHVAGDVLRRNGHAHQISQL